MPIPKKNVVLKLKPQEWEDVLSSLTGYQSVLREEGESPITVKALDKLIAKMWKEMRKQEGIK
jgi:hypothetical protein